MLVLGGCGEQETGPIRVSAIGGPPQLLNPNLRPLDPPSAFLVEAAAQGLVRFDAAGEIEPALAQSWIVSDDGLRYTLRIRRTDWPDGSRVTAEQVASRLRAVVSRASRSPFKPVLGAMDNAVAMTDQVLEISLVGPRANFLQLLAQPETAIMLNGAGTGPYRVAERAGEAVRLTIPREEDDETGQPHLADILLRGEPAARAVARFAEGEADLVAGGTIGDLAFARAARQGNDRLVFDPVAGLFGLSFAGDREPLDDPAIRAALSMAIDRDALVTGLGAPGLQPRVTLLPAAVTELPNPVAPDWAASPLPMRRERAARAIAELETPLRLRVAMPEGPGYRLVFAHLRHDWRLIGVEAERVGPAARADLRLVDAIAPAMLATWYFRFFTCEAGPVCSEEADQALEKARVARAAAERRTQLETVDQLFAETTPFIPLAASVRWSLVAPRLTGFRPNPFARHPASTLIVEDN
ncbi:MAG: ABC transporter substrate-binding protein [Allosphingosinicella sp.]